MTPDDDLVEDILSGAKRNQKRQAPPTSESVPPAKRQYTKKVPGVQLIDAIPVARRRSMSTRSSKPDSEAATSSTADSGAPTSSGASESTGDKKQGPMKAIMIEAPQRPRGRPIKKEIKPIGLKEAQAKATEKGGKRVDKNGSTVEISSHLQSHSILCAAFTQQAADSRKNEDRMFRIHRQRVGAGNQPEQGSHVRLLMQVVGRSQNSIRHDSGTKYSILCLSRVQMVGGLFNLIEQMREGGQTDAILSPPSAFQGIRERTSPISPYSSFFVRIKLLSVHNGINSIKSLQTMGCSETMDPIDPEEVIQILRS